MYNGVGVSTPRGTGTSGYIEASLSMMKGPKHVAKENVKRIQKKSPILLEHEKRRKIEVKCLELRNKLRESNKNEEEIEKEVNSLRQNLLNDKQEEVLTPKIPITAPEKKKDDEKQ